MQEAASGLALLLVGLILDWSAYIAKAERQMTSAWTGVRILTGLIPALLFCAGIGFAALYPLGRREHESLRQELPRGRAGGRRMTVNQSRRVHNKAQG